MTMQPASAVPVTVDYMTVLGGNATAADLTEPAGTIHKLVFEPGETSQIASVLINGNLVPQPDRTFLVELMNPVNATIGDGVATGTIVDDDTTPTVTSPTGPFDTTLNSTGHEKLDPTGNYAVDAAQDPDGRTVLFGNIDFSGQTTVQLSATRLNPNGSYDTTFNGTGIATLKIPGASMEGRGGAVYQSGPERGKILVAGEAFFGGPELFVVARFNTDGTLDTTFGTGGYTTVSITGTDEGTSVAIYDSGVNAGKIVVAGQFNGNGAPFVELARLNDDGTTDATFGTGGHSIYRPTFDDSGPPQTTTVSKVLIDSNGNLLVAGGTGVPGTYIAGQGREVGGYIARFDGNGNIDPTFGTEGITFIPMNPGNRTAAQINDIALQPDGKILGVASTYGGFGQVLLAA